MRRLKKYYSELRHRRDSIRPLSLLVAVQENQLQRVPDSRANNLDLEIYDVVHSLKIELNKLTEKVDKLTERKNKSERELPTHTEPVYCSRMYKI